jgi:hypothetical protein
VTASRQTNPVDQLARTFSRSRGSAQFERHLHVFLRRQRRNQLEALKNEPDFFTAEPSPVVLGKFGEIRIIEDHCATCRCIQTGKQAE